MVAVLFIVVVRSIAAAALGKERGFLEVEEFVRKEKLTQRKPERVMESGIKAF